MNCPQCGHAVADHEAFCTNCGHYVLPLQDQGRPIATTEITEDGTSRTPPVGFPQPGAQPVKKVAQRIYPPQTPTPAPAQTQPPQAAAPQPVQQLSQPPKATASREPAHVPASHTSHGESKRVKQLKSLAITFGVLALLAIAATIYVLATTSSLQVQLNKAQRENSSAQASTAQLESQISDLTADLDAANAEKANLNQQVADLTAQIGNLETNVNQSQYDKDAAVRDMDELKTNLAAAEETNEILEAQLTETQQVLADTMEQRDTLQEEKDALDKEVSSYQDEISFYNSHVVFVMLSASDKYYHRYSCPQFTQKNFLSYSTKLAESNGYTPCPECIGTTD